ncbi:MAG: translation elongation factor Ts [Candidatus Oxydemutatoraceae bacterium WSBS_2016_MAG_OTU14]
MQITASMVKSLRERTGAGMMECKKFLSEAEGDADKAIELLRKSGQLKAAKRGGKIAAEGQVHIAQNPNNPKHYILIEVNCETDFVARDESFEAFVQDVITVVLQHNPKDVEALVQCQSSTGVTIEKARENLISKIGENIQIRRFQSILTEGNHSASYVHSQRIAVLVDAQGGDEELSKDIAMHVAAAAPVCIDESEVPEELLRKEKDIYTAQAQESGKPDEIVQKMTAGKVRKFLEEITLLGQNFVKDPAVRIQSLLKEKSAKVLAFHRYELGEGIEKKQENFADEVMEQVKQSASV